MITAQIRSHELATIRFAYSPLLELVTSYMVLRKPILPPSYQQWAVEAQDALRGVELPYMDALITWCGYIPDFLTPTPETTVQSIEDEFIRVRETPEAIIRKHVQRVIHFSEERSSIQQYFLDFPREAVECLINELRFYWNRTLAQHWGAMRSVLENDVLYHARMYAIDGMETLFAELPYPVRIEDGYLKLDKPQRKRHEGCGDLKLTGADLQLVPALFVPARSMMYQIEPEWLPMLMYSARGTGLWYQEPVEMDLALEIVMGAGKARLLQALISPANTSELARKLHITAGAVSQHLSRLHQAGLVESHRVGNRVFYRLSPRGERLLEVFD